MRIAMTMVLTILLVLAVTACSMPDLGGSASTQEGSTLETGNLQEDGLQGGTAETDLNSGEMTGTNDAGQQAGQVTSEKLVRVVLYFASGDGNALKQEERDVRVVDGAILRACVNALIEGPISEGLLKTMPEGTALKGISLRDKVATVDLSKEFADVTGAQGDIAKWSVVNTLTRFGGVEKVRFHIDGEEMNGSDGIPLGDLSPVLLNADGSIAPQ